MASRVSLTQPYTVATLPSVEEGNGYVVGEVYAGAPGSKKRKRSELAVGVYGEGVNLYDVSSSKLVTSYALPPQSMITCPPCSSRTRFSKTKFERRTYVSTSRSDFTERKITLFRDISEASDQTQASTASHTITHSKAPVQYVGSIASQGSEANKKLDLLLVKKDGEIQCLDGDSLELQWSSPASALGQATAGPLTNIEVEYAHLTNAHAARQGILQGRPDVLAFFPQEISEDGFNPDILVIITKSQPADTTEKVRTLHMVSLPRKATTHLNGTIHSVELLVDTPLPLRNPADKSFFSLSVSAGLLQILEPNNIVVLELHETVPKKQCEIYIEAASSFLRISNTSLMLSTKKSISILNPKFHSILASITLEKPDDEEQQIAEGNLKRKRDHVTQGARLSDCKFISYYPKLGAAVAISGNELVTIGVDYQTNKSRNLGLLIDSLGCSDGQIKRARTKKLHGDSVKWDGASQYLQGSMGFEGRPNEVAIFREECTKAAEKGDATTFEDRLTTKFNKGFGKDWDPEGGNPAEVDRQWILYSLSKIFRWEEQPEGDYKLGIVFYPPNLFQWLIRTGNMTVVNVESALRSEIRSSLMGPIPAGQLVNALVEFDREMDLLLQLIGRNLLAAPELVHAIRQLMDSLDLLGKSASTKQRLLMNGEEDIIMNGNIDEEVRRLEAEVEEDLNMAEYQLGAGSGVRGEALSLAMSKLYTCPQSSIVEALQATFTARETVSLIYLLRFELAKGGWTSRYLDTDPSEAQEDDVETPENSIILITSLMSNCIDAIGAGGWLSGDARLVNGSHYESEELIQSLKLEVSAALEGIEEAVYMKGLTAEMIRYGDAVRKTLSQADAVKKIQHILTLPTTEKELSVLPIGLKAEKQISKLRVGAGGEVVKRSKRDIGRLKSRQVGKYTRERINV